jgi:CheY-specific phosphatase CheX
MPKVPARAKLQKVLADSIAETLDAMFFTACLTAPEAEPAPQPQLAAQVAFEGNPPGRLTLRMPALAARSLAANFLGEEENDLSERQVGDVLCELANMICGFVLSRVEGAAEFRLGAPRMVESGELDRPRGGVAHAVETGCGVLEASLEMEDPICPP